MRINSGSNLGKGVFAPVFARLLTAATLRGIVIAMALYLASLVALSIADLPLAQEAPGVTKPDLTFGYRHADILAILTAYGAVGRQAYLISLVVDSVMPVLFAAVTLLVVARVAPRWLGWLGIAPLMFMVFDLIENALLAVMVTQYPAVSPALVSFTSPITMIKLLSYGVALPTLIIGVLSLIFTWLIQRRNASVKVS